MICGIMQPSYIPWRGAFDLIQRVDVYVFYDDVQYVKRSWRNRNRIKTASGTKWLTIPVQARGNITDGIPIRSIRLDAGQDWSRSHREQLHQAYRQAPHYRSQAGLLDRIYAEIPELLADFTIATTELLARALGIEDTRFVRSSELDVVGTGTDRVASIMEAVGADHLINGPTARGYTDEALLTSRGLSTEYIKYDYAEYPQLHGPYEPQLSVLDMMLMVGAQARHHLGSR